MTNFEEKYPDLFNNVVSAIGGYEQSFISDTVYAGVKVDYLITQGGQIKKHIDWLLKKEGTGDDVNLRNVNEFYSYFLVPQPEEDFKTELDDKIVISEPLPRTEPTISKPPVFEENDFLPPISLSDRLPISSPRIGGEGEMGNISIGSSTSRGGVLGGRNYSNPQDAIDNEFRFRTRVLTREL